MGAMPGIRVVHLASLGPGPYAAMLLADMGAEVVIVDRPGGMMVSTPQESDPRRRGQQSIALDLRQDAARDVLNRLIARADVLIEGMRPGVAERLGAGPDHCHALNPGLIYARVTGWGQTGPLAMTAGHDINYIALSGALAAMGDPDRPPPVPLNLLGDYAGGGAFVVMRILAALLERERSGRGQVIDGAILDGVASLTTATLGMKAAGRWGPRGTNLLDGGAPWYRCYRARDGGYLAVGAIEPPFWAALLAGLGDDPADWPRDDHSRWPEMADRLAALFATRDRDDWAAHFAATDACVTPVLGFDEMANHPQHVARATYTEGVGGLQPRPLTGGALPAAPPGIGRDGAAVLQELGFDADAVEALRRAGTIA